MEHFLYVAVVGLLLVVYVVGCNSGEGTTSFPLEAPPSFWKNGYCRQETVDVSHLKDGIVRARVDGRWQQYKLVELPQGFIKWALKRRMELMQGKGAFFLGAHCGLVATYGCPRSDSRFHINNAAKGVGFLPKPEKLKEVNNLIEAAFKKDLHQRHALMHQLYQKFDLYFDKTRLISLEEFTSEDFQTQTFINQMVNPACSIVFLDMTSYELKVIAHILHPSDPKLDDYQKEVVRFANLIHSFGHGGRRKPTRKLMAVIYYIVEAYDNSPRGPHPGSRVVPPK